MEKQHKGFAIFLRKSSPENKEKAEKKPFVPYDKRNEITPLVLFLSIVPQGQEEYIQKLLFQHHANIFFRMRAEGTAHEILSDVLATTNNAKRIIASLIKRDTFQAIKGPIANKFATSPYSAGIALTIPVFSLYGVSAYKILTDKRTLNSEAQKEVIPMNENEYEAIYAIVNDGFSDLVMAAARDAGARGGTIVHARGTGNPDAQKFFGIVVTPEKEMVLIVVKKDIRDQVLAAIGKECGLQTKGQGICFSLPVESVIGLAAQNDSPEEESEEEPAESL